MTKAVVLHKATLRFALLFAAPIAVLLAPAQCQAGVYRLGMALGFGGAGVQKQQDVAPSGSDTPQIVTVQRAEGPATFSIFVEDMLSPKVCIAFEHSRGVKLGPFGSHVSFTGVNGRYYFFAAPTPSRSLSSDTTISIRKFGLFAGGGVGLAKGTVEIPGDTVPLVHSSGVYVGGRAGAEYLFASNIGIRPEIVYNMTLLSSGKNPATLNEFSAQVGFFIFL